MPLDTVPQEVLEHIALFAATQTNLGPPSGLIPLLLTSRQFYARLSIHTNHHLYACIFAVKFDTRAVQRRLGSACTTPVVLVAELQRRCVHLKLIRTRSEAILKTTEAPDSPLVHRLLSHAYLMMLENEGQNERQLLEYAGMGGWLRDYWFHDRGASRAAAHFLHGDTWVPDTDTRALAMWLFWFLLKPEHYHPEDEDVEKALNILKIFSLSAHKYRFSNPTWKTFFPEPRTPRPSPIDYYSESRLLPSPPLATPAILSFLALGNRLVERVNCNIPLPPLHGPTITPEWESEWERCRSIGDHSNIHNICFKPGSIEGIWEGIFTYTEFTSYAHLLAGAGPSIVQRSMSVRHRQTWKLREHHLLCQGTKDSMESLDTSKSAAETGAPLDPGDPLRSFFPPGTQIRETAEGILVLQPNREEVLNYRRAPSRRDEFPEHKKETDVVQDVIVVGEGHSAWGQFNLIGRVRPCDGYVSLSKEYVDGDRGKWLYRGYIVGDKNANYSGRWRDTLTPVDIQGYEGCFAMSRRR